MVNRVIRSMKISRSHFFFVETVHDTNSVKTVKTMTFSRQTNWDEPLDAQILTNTWIFFTKAITEKMLMELLF